eukprot:gene24433-27639_t
MVQRGKQIEPAAAGHLHVEQQQVGLQRSDLRDGLRRADRLANDLHARDATAAENCARRIADKVDAKLAA